MALDLLCCLQLFFKLIARILTLRYIGAYAILIILHSTLIKEMSFAFFYGIMNFGGLSDVQKDRILFVGGGSLNAQW